LLNLDRHGIYFDTNDQGFNIHYIKDAELRGLLTTHETPSVVADLIIQRDITDAEQIATLLDTMSVTPNVLTDGVI